MSERETTFRRELISLLPRIWRFGLSLTGATDACNDLVQATCERALTRSHQWRPGTRLDSWVFSVMHSIWKNELRAQSIRRGAGFVDPDSQVFDQQLPNAESSAMAREIFDMVMGLPEAQRVPLLLVYVEGYSYKEAARILEVPVGTIMSRLARGRVRLAESLQQPEVQVNTGRIR